MQASVWEKAKEIFGRAITIDPNDRAQYLNEACSDDKDVRREVEELLRSFDDSNDFMEQHAITEVASEIAGVTARLEPGQRLIHYEIVRQLGEGGMGEVYLAEDTKLGRKVAIKVLPSNTSADREANMRLLREARSAAKLDHPNICTIHEIAESDGRRFIVMQYVEGDNLAQRIKAGGLDRKESIRLAAQIAEALAEAHSAGIIHRDIKPANVIITSKGQAKVLDFGLAKQVLPSRSVDDRSATSHFLSRTGEVIGTVPYMSPEQVKGEKLDERTDIFSLGAMLYELLTGRQPFHRESNAETIAALLNSDPPTDELSPKMRQIVARCLAKDRTQRYSRAVEVVSDLRSLDDTEDLKTSHFHEQLNPHYAETVRGTAVQESSTTPVVTAPIRSGFFLGI